MGNTLETKIKQLDIMKAYKYLGVEESHIIEHKKEKDRLKKIKIDFKHRAESKR
jgi:uncharacterized protein YkvS